MKNDGSTSKTYYNKDGSIFSIEKVTQQGDSETLYYKKGQLSGKLVRTHDDKEVRTEEYENGKLKKVDFYTKGQHICKTYHTNGQMLTKESYVCEDPGIDWVRGNQHLKKNGPYESYYENGQLREKSTYKDGKRVASEQYDQNGHLTKVIKSKNDQRISETYNPKRQLMSRTINSSNGCTIEEHYENGQIKGKETYQNDQLIRSEEYFSNGKLKSVCTYKNEKKDGTLVEYHDNGQLSLSADYKNGELDGTCIKFNKIGEPISDFKYKNGKENGICIAYLSDGSQYTYNYKDGKQIENSKSHENNTKLKTPYNSNNYNRNNKDGR